MDRMPKPVDWPRWRTWVVWSSAAALVVIATLFALNMYGLVPSSVTIALAILFSVPPIVTAVSVVVAMRRRIAAAGYRLCLRCHYPLDPNEEQGRCPECGDAYDLSDVERKWREGIN